MPENQVNESPLDDKAAVEELQKKAIVNLRTAKGRSDSLEDAILAFLRDGYRLGLSPSELIDFFCVSTPNIVETAGYVGADGDVVVALFDKLHDQFRRTDRR